VHVYRLKLHPIETMWGSPAQLTAEALAEWLPEDAAVRDLTNESWGHVAEIGLQRGSDAEAHLKVLNELLGRAQVLGYSFAEAEIASVADRAMEMAFGFGVGGLGLGSSAKNSEAAFLGAAVGWLAGLFVGSQLQKIEPVYQVQWTPHGGWMLFPMSRQGMTPRLTVQRT
jgi:hypothetical protein